MQYLRKQTGKQVALRDVHNMVARRMEQRRGGLSVEKWLDSVLQNMCQTRGNHAAVNVDETKKVQTITLRTRQMRHWFKAFPEVLMIDATHNTNESCYKLFSFMVHNIYGNISK
ncbi:ABC transporter [Phytophthora megakarya]|uniref:ABC transporter n=1 Tax=Phytophthora megakarya TaxID=4795 RepID=A0A225V5Z5_9STRA|nr:ABC transporter [Phytophthora megakarya]